MSQPKHDDSELSEVRAVLGRLQRISRNPQAASAEITGDTSPRPAAPAEGGNFSRPAGIASLVAKVNAAPWPVKAAVSIGPVLTVAAGVAIFASIEREPAQDKEPPPPAANLQSAVQASDVPQANALSQATDAPQASASAQQAPKPAAALQVASDLIASGQVRAARDILLRATKEESADVAWALARSYDPNYLVTIRAADAAPDVAEATRWYRAWYDIAVKQGLVADSVSLDRIIRSMSLN
jgi:hypothetical protein